MREILVIFLALGLVAVVAYVRRRRRHVHDEFLWRTESIHATVRRDDDGFFCQYLNLDQQLRPDESGWVNKKLDMPETWQAESVTMTGDRILLVLADGRRYSLGRDNVGELSFQVTDGGPGKSAEILHGRGLCS